MTSEIFVQKRNGRGKEPFNIDKIHSMVGYATEDKQALVPLTLR